MKILHCCLACFYIDNYGYQENILPRQHKLQGHEVEILASTETYISNTKLSYGEPASYMSTDGIPVVRVAYGKYLPHFIMRKLRIYEGIYQEIDRFNPDIIFVHDCQFIDIRHIARYSKKNPHVKIFVDCHTDFINSAKNWLSKNILHKVIYRFCAKTIEPYATKFYGVLPARCDFLNVVYGIAREKIDLLSFGGEDNKIDLSKRDKVRKRICTELCLNDDDFILVTGGKLDKHKNTANLIDALELIGSKRAKLIIFGSLMDDVKYEIEGKLNNSNVKYVGWIDADKAYDYFIGADLVVFPGLHSVLWEQAVACGVPCVFRDMEGFHHVDTGGNCAFLKNGSTEEIAQVLKDTITNQETYNEMRRNALGGANRFFYSEIARRSIQDAFK